MSFKCGEMNASNLTSSLDQRFNRVFNSAMYDYTTMVMRQLLDSYQGFEPLKLVVDVGGGLGHTIKAITLKYPQIKGINFDMPHVVEHAPSIRGVEHVGGDMFQSVPKGDAIFMKSILHGWSDAQCLVLLKNCYKATPEDGKVIVMEMVDVVKPEATPSSKLTAQCDILMMVQNTGGKERARDELMALAVGAGFEGIRFVLHVCNYWVMEFYK